MFVCLGDDGSLPATNKSTWALQYSGAGSPTWTSQGLGTNPGVRISPGVTVDPGTAVDPSGPAVLLMGGQDTSSPIPVFKNDVWKLTQSGGNWTWAPVLTAGTPPPPRYGHAVVFSGTRLFVIGGTVDNPSPNDAVNDVWVLDFASPTPFWKEIYSNSPMSPRSNLTAVVDTLNNQIVVFGGSHTNNFRNDTWSISLTATPVMTLLSPSTTPPSGRDTMTAVYDTSAALMIVFGGNGAGGSLNDVWALSLSGTPKWTPILVTGTPPGVRAGYAAIFDDATRRLLLFGGLDFVGGSFYADTQQLQF
jgi:hypothetical protein